MVDIYNNYSKLSKAQQYFIRYFDRLSKLCLSRFTYDNMPRTIKNNFLEKCLLRSGKCIFFKDDEIGEYAVMEVNLNGQHDIYGIPNNRVGFANKYIECLDKTNSVLISDNVTDYPLFDYIVMYADSLANMRLTRDINIFAQRTPFTFAGSKEYELTAKNLFKQYNDFAPFISVKDNYTDIDKFKVLKTDAPKIFGDMQDAIDREISDFCCLIGIDSVAGVKKERLIADEIQQNADQTYINREAYLSNRQRAVDQINELFGLDIKVRYVGDGVSNLSNIDNRGVGNGNLHN